MNKKKMDSRAYLVLIIATIVVLCLSIIEPSFAVEEQDADSSIRNSFTVQIRATPKVDDAYCITRVSPPDWAIGRTVIGFEPLPGSAAHHIMLFTCENQGVPEDARKDQCSSDEGNEDICGSIQFVWAHGGSPLWLPPNVGLKLGSKKGEISFALQVHFGMSTTWSDQSGVRLILAEREDEERKWETPKVWLLAPNRFPGLRPKVRLTLIGTGQVETVRTEIMVFAVRTHAHSRGIWNEVRVTRNGETIWHYKRSVQLPQSFIPLPNHVRLLQGDKVEFACAYDTTNESEVTFQGATKKDEMCNVYLMFYNPTFTKNSAVLARNNANSFHTRLRKIDTCMSQVFAGSTIPAKSQIVGVATDSRTNKIYVFHRGNTIWEESSFNSREEYTRGTIAQDVIMEFDKDGQQLIQTMGANQFYLPHSIKVDPFQNGVVWLADVGSHLITEYNVHTKAIVRTAGTKLVPGRGPSHFCKPTDVTFSSDKQLIYVSDGYCNNRIVVLQRSNLAFVKEFGTQGSGMGQFDLPHSITTTNCGTREFLVVSDRENGRVQVLNAENGSAVRVIQSWESVLLPYSTAIDPSTGRLFVGLVNRADNSRRGTVWYSHHGLCDAVAANTVQGSQICNYNRDKLQEPHMLAISGRQILVAEAIDSKLEGRLVSIAF